ncbi:MAG: glycosyltransferase family 4 protein [Planctomycetia bacterium]|nr:glycosyltransferase family 4 protein [Planctomycetia bacterium]
MKVLALVEGLNHVCYRYRIEAFAWAMRERGLLLEAAPLEHGLLHRLALLRRGLRADVVILQRKLLPLWQLRLLRHHAKRLIYDVDDSLFQRDSYSHKGPDSWVRLASFWATLQAADAVSVGNEYLKQRAGGYIDADRVRVMPTCLEPRTYRVARHERVGAEAKLIWIGQQSTLPSLERVGPHLEAAAGRLPGLRLAVVCDTHPEVPGVRVVPRPWSKETEADELAQGDIGINWLPDDAWSRGKCGLKVLQYMAAGLPVVANPVGMNREMVIDGRTGLLASTPAEWAEAIRRLADDPRLRREMGARGRQLVEERFSVDRWAPRFARFVDEVARGRTASGQRGSNLPERAPFAKPMRRAVA